MFQAGHFGKLKPRADGPYRVLKKVNDNTYKLELLGHYNVSATFNVVDLSPYKGEGDNYPDSRSSLSEEGEDDAVNDTNYINLTLSMYFQEVDFGAEFDKIRTIDENRPNNYENLDYLKDIVDFEVEGEENVVITRNTTDDPWLNKLVGNGTSIGQIDDAISNLGGRFNHEENDPEDDIVDPKFKAKPFVRYPSFDPSTPWDQCQPFLGMKFENPQQLKYMLENYRVANGYQLWFMQNDHSKLLVYCDRDAWFLSLLQEDLELGYGGDLTVISDGHKGLLEAVEGILPDSDHRCSAAFKNGISESFNSNIVPAKGKPIITMLEDIRSWLVYPGGFREVEVRRRDYAYGVNLHTKQCGCRFWELSGIPCVHAMTAYYHMNMEPELGNKMDMEALAEVERENASEEAEQEMIRQIWAENEANDLYWENKAK
nr:zinc finger, PMZ-type [Tanacetum cinerariifolium]